MRRRHGYYSGNSGCLFDTLIGGMLIAALIGHCVYVENSRKVDDGMYVGTVKKDVYILYYDETTGKYTVHDGNVSFLQSSLGRSGTSLEVTKFDFDCQEDSIISNNKFEIMSKEPVVCDEYDICEECFGKK